MQTVSVGICTYKRPDVLRRCVKSVLAQEKITINQIIIVDNDIQKSGHIEVEKFFDEAKIREIQLVYEIEEKKGISSARNKVISLNSSELLAFIDDDETADVYWLVNLYNALIEYKADAVRGPIIWQLPKEFEKSHKGVFKTKHNVLKTGLELSTCNTGNVLIRKEILTLREGPFNLALNNVGGEDTELFNFLNKSYHCRYFYCNEAKVYEYQPYERFTYKWQNHRAYRGGWNTSFQLCINRNRILVLLFVLITIGPSFFKNIINKWKEFTFKTFLLFVTKSFYAQLGKLGYFFGYKLDDF